LAKLEDQMEELKVAMLAGNKESTTGKNYKIKWMKG
jgi:hypothetical protein